MLVTVETNVVFAKMWMKSLTTLSSSNVTSNYAESTPNMLLATLIGQ